MKKTVIIDVETTGLNKSDDFIWQVCYIVCDEYEDKIVLKELREIVLVDAILSVLYKKSKFRNSIKKILKRKIKKLSKVIEGSDIIVGHNIKFEKMFLSEYSINLENTFCTMISSTNLCKINHHYYVYKYPKLAEAVKILLKHEVDEEKLHDASYDVILTTKLYAYLQNKKIDDTQLRYKTKNLLRNIVGIIVSPIGTHKEKRRKTIEKIEKFKEKLKNIIKTKHKQEDCPF